jgi:prophage regulatory protein
MIVMKDSAAQPDEGLIRLRAVLEILQISRSTFYAGIKARRYPSPLHISPRTSAWRRRDIIALINGTALLARPDHHRVARGGHS